jgi:hypothetical protein
MVLEVDYRAQWGRRLNQTLEINQVPRPDGSGNAILRPFPQFSGLQDVSMPYGISSYDALVVRVDKRFNAGLAFQAITPTRTSRTTFRAFRAITTARVIGDRARMTEEIASC